MPLEAFDIFKAGVDNRDKGGSDFRNGHLFGVYIPGGEEENALLLEDDTNFLLEDNTNLLLE